jgi:hypothetical protein
MLLKQLSTVVLTACLSISTPLNAIANETVHPKHHPQYPCDVLRDAFVWSLFKPIGCLNSTRTKDNSWSIMSLRSNDCNKVFPVICIPSDLDFTIPYCLLYPLNPSEDVNQFLDIM